jgi:hypothetical protein
VLAIVVLTLTILMLAKSAYSATGPSQQQIKAIIVRVFPDDPVRALCIADHESDGTPNHFTPTAQNGTNTGLFQIDEATWDPARNPRAIAVVGHIVWARMHEALYNAKVARRIYLYEKRAGRDPWGPWSTRIFCNA